MHDINLLIDGLIRRDEASIRVLVKEYGAYIFHVVYMVCKNSEDSEEATQDVILKVLKKAESFDFSCALKTWLYTIARRTAIDYVRKKKFSDDLDEVYDLDSGDRADELVKIGEQRDEIEALLSVLTETDREIVELFYLNEKSIVEVVEVTGLSESNVKVRLYRARKLMFEHHKNTAYYEG